MEAKYRLRLTCRLKQVPLSGRFVRSASAFLLGSLTSQGIAAITGLLIARWLSVRDYAVYTAVFTTMSAITLLTKGGIHHAYTGMLGKSWPDLERAAQLTKAAQVSRRILSWIVMPPLLATSIFLLARLGASNIAIAVLCSCLILYWWADMDTRIIDQILVFSRKVGWLQAIDSMISGARLAIIVPLGLLHSLTASLAVLSGALMAAARIAPVRKAIFDIVPVNVYRAKARAEDLAEIRRSTLRQIPSELFTVMQTQIIIFVLTLFSGNHSVAGFGALGRIGQLLLPVQSFSFAYFVPVFAKAERNMLRLFALVFLAAALPGIILISISVLYPGILLILVGPNYSMLRAPLVAVAASVSFTSVGGIIWNLIAHRGWNRWSWLQIPVGLVWCVLAPLYIKISTITGAAIFQGGFALGLYVVAAIEMYAAYRRRELR